MGIQINGTNDTITTNDGTISIDGGTTITGSLTGTTGLFSGDVGVAGTLTSEDKTNVDSVGLITARTGIKVGPITGVAATHYADGSIRTTGIITATTFGSDTNSIFTTGGTERVRIDSSGRLLLGTTTEGHAEGDDLTVSSSSITGITVRSGTSSPGNIFFSDGTSGNAERMGIIRYDHNGDYMMFGVNYGEKLRIASGGQIFVANEAGTIDTTARLGEGNRLQLSGLSSNDGISVVRYSTSYGPYGFNMGRSKSGTLGTNTIVGNHNDLGHITFWGADGTDFNQACQISGVVDGTPSDGTDMPGRLVFKTTPDGSGTPTERLRITSGGQLNLGGFSTQTTHLLHLQSTGDAGIHIRADSDNSGENDNPYISMGQDGSTTQQFKLGMVGQDGQEFAQSVGNASFLHANNANAQPLQLAHMDNLAVTISNTEQSHFHSLSGIGIGGVKIANRGNDTGAALLLQGHNNTGSPGQATNTQLTHDGGSLVFEITHAGGRAMHIGSARRIRFPGVWGVNGSSMRTVQIESDGNLCAPSSIREAKINIESISDVSWLYDFNPVTFNFRTKTEVNGENVWGDEADDGGLQYGFIADEVEAVNQDLCFYDDGKLSGVHYDRMMSPLIKAVQDQKKEIDALKTKVAALEGS